jgi:hypothetical protein
METSAGYQFFQLSVLATCKDGQIESIYVSFLQVIVTNISAFSDLRNQCIQRGLLFDKQTSLAEIYLFEHRGITMKSDALIKWYSTLHGSEDKYEALGAACCGAARGRYTNRLRILLRQSLAHDEKLDAYFLKIPNKDVFDVLWLLAENSSDKMGKEWSTLSQQVSLIFFLI